jgi:hypothetical protein
LKNPRNLTPFTEGNLKKRTLERSKSFKGEGLRDYVGENEEIDIKNVSKYLKPIYPRK